MPKRAGAAGTEVHTTPTVGSAEVSDHRRLPCLRLVFIDALMVKVRDWVVATGRSTCRSASTAALDAFADRWNGRYPATVRLWRTHWEQFTPFLAFPPEVRRVIYTTNLIESINARLRKVTRNRGQFPSEQAALKVLYLAVRNLEEFRRPTVGLRSSGWKQALQAFTIYFQGRIPTP